MGYRLLQVMVEINKDHVIQYFVKHNTRDAQFNKVSISVTCTIILYRVYIVSYYTQNEQPCVESFLKSQFGSWYEIGLLYDSS